ncbi:MAG: amidohydrolase family protein [Rhodococcus sp.]|nr:amidohydrolase family protein [Rhodococcus sp. (in: high G+C Gram-positive bacteria)]
MFNADDLPVEGFIAHHDKLEWIGGRGIARLLDRYIQHRAPDYRQDLARMRALLAADGVEVAEALDPSAEQSGTEHAVLAELADDPELFAEIAADLAAQDAATTSGAESTGAEAFSIVGDVRRLVAWASLFAQSRVNLPALYDKCTGGEVGLAVPMLVDLDAGVRDRSPAGQREQVELFELLSTISMLGRLPGASDLVLHPFVAFDPLRQLAHRDAIGLSPRELVAEAVLSRGFLGVKVYPPMGWKPSGNAERTDISRDDGQRLDEIVLDLAGWCQANDVPITAHGNESNEAHRSFRGFGAPEQWEPVLAACPGLRLNLGHFGGAHAERKDYTWTFRIAEMMDSYPHLYADVSCHRVDTAEVLDQQMAVIEELHRAGRNVLERVQFGTDWYMQAANPAPDMFLDTYRSRWRECFGDNVTEDFLHRNALRFLGLSGTGANSDRLRGRYDDLGVTAPEWLA